MKMYLLVISLVACAVGDTLSVISKLEWVRSADAQEMFVQDTVSNNLRFFGMYDSSLSLPAVDLFDFEMCYKNILRIEQIARIDDTIESTEYSGLINDAIRFAEEYNILMIDYVRRNTLCSCEEGEEWGLFFSQLRSFIEGPLQDQGAMGYYIPDSSEVKFSIYLRDRERVQEVLTKIPEVLFENNIRREVTFRFSERYKRAGEWTNNILGTAMFKDGVEVLIAK